VITGEELTRQHTINDSQFTFELKWGEM